MKHYFTISLFGMLAAGLTGCITPAPGPRSQFYQLQPVPAETAAGAEAGDGPVVRIGPVQVSEYLHRPQLVTRVGEHQVAYDELRRWAEPLQDNILWVLSRNLTAAIPEARILPFAGLPTAIDSAISVPINIFRLEQRPDGSVLLSASWMVVSSAASQTSKPAMTTMTRTASSTSTEDMVATQSTLIRELGEKIAADIREALP